MPIEKPKYPDGEVKFKDTSINGYTSMTIENGEIVAIKGDKYVIELHKGMGVELEGDIFGYVPSGHKDGEKVTITSFKEPFAGGITDHIIEVTGGGKKGMVKPGNIKNRTVSAPTTITKDGRMQIVHTLET